MAARSWCSNGNRSMVTNVLPDSLPRSSKVGCQIVSAMGRVSRFMASRSSGNCEVKPLSPPSFRQAPTSVRTAQPCRSKASSVRGWALCFLPGIGKRPPPMMRMAASGLPNWLGCRLGNIPVVAHSVSLPVGVNRTVAGRVTSFESRLLSLPATIHTP